MVPEDVVCDVKGMDFVEDDDVACCGSVSERSVSLLLASRGGRTHMACLPLVQGCCCLDDDVENVESLVAITSTGTWLASLSSFLSRHAFGRLCNDIRAVAGLAGRAFSAKQQKGNARVGNYRRPEGPFHRGTDW